MQVSPDCLDFLFLEHDLYVIASEIQDEGKRLSCLLEGEATAYVFTYNKSWIRHFEQVLQIKPDEVNDFGGRSYTIPKKWLKLPRGPRKLSAETKKRLATQLAKGRHHNGLVAPKAHSRTGLPAKETVGKGKNH